MIDLAGIPCADQEASAAVAARAAEVLRPAGALARLDELAAWLAGWQRTARPAVVRPACLIFVADHGVASKGVSAYPADVTASMMGALQQGKATANVLAREANVALQAIDVGIGRPSDDLAEGAALDSDRFEQCWRAGVDAVNGIDADLLVLGEMGIGNTTAAAAVAAALLGGPVEQWVGRGTGVNGDAFDRKEAAVRVGAARVAGAAPLEVLRQLGGLELVAMAGAAYQARRRSIPVLLDGYVVTAAVAPLEVGSPGLLDHCQAAHVSSEPGHRRLLSRLGMRPLLDLGLRLGEGSGALLAVPLVRMAAAAVVDVATFGEWGVAR